MTFIYVCSQPKSGLNQSYLIKTSLPPTGEFRVLQLLPKKKKQERFTIPKALTLPPREKHMKPDQNWGSVWPGPKTYHPDAVPLPLRMGFPIDDWPSFGKKANVELMKIPNFLHLTPPVVQKQCEAIKQFCTPWPKELNTNEDCEKHFPLEIITSDYCYSSPTIREPLARIVSIRVKLSSLNLDTHARDKILRLLGKRYDSETDYITIVADRCPTRKQNWEYAHYLLTAVYHEAWVHANLLERLILIVEVIYELLQYILKIHFIKCRMRFNFETFHSYPSLIQLKKPENPVNIVFINVIIV